MRVQDWEAPSRHRLTMLLGPVPADSGRLAVIVNGDPGDYRFYLPGREGFDWFDALSGEPRGLICDPVPGRTVVFVQEREAAR